MKFYTVEEFNSIKVYELDDVTYKKVERKFITMFRNEKLGKSFLEKQMTIEVKTLSANSYVNIMDCFTIL